MAKKCSVTPQQAYIDYLSLGAERSLEKLHEIYTRDTPKPPSIDTLKLWSTKHHWQNKLCADSHEIEYEARRKSTEIHSESLYIQRKEFYDMSTFLVRKAYVLLQDVSVLDKEAMENISVLCNSAIECVKCAQSMKF